MSDCKFNITLRMLNIHTFCWLRDYAKDAIMLHMALDAIEITLKENYDDNEWMDLMFHMVMDPGCWHNVKEVFVQELGITEPESCTIEGSPSELHLLPSETSITSGDQDSITSSPGIEVSELHSSPDIPIKNQKPTSELWSTCPCPVNPAWLMGTEERNDVITKWIRSQIEHHPDFILYLQSQTELQTMSKVLNQYRIISRMLGLLLGLMMPVSYDGAPSCMVKMDHILKALGLNSDWNEKCCETLALLSWYENSVDALLELLKFVDRSYTEDMLQSPLQSIRAVVPSASSQKSVRRGLPGQTSRKVKHRKLSANWFIDVATVENDEEGKEDEGEEEEGGAEELIHCPQPVGPSGKQSYQQTIDAIIEQLNRKIPEEAAFKSPKISQLPSGVTLPPQKSIFIVDFFSASARIFAFQSMMSQGFQASSPLEVWQNLPPLHLHAHKPIVLLPLKEGTLLATFKAHKTLPHQSWVRIKRPTLYKGDFSYVETSDEHDAVVIVAPRQCPYNIPEHLNKRVEFDVELVRMTNLILEPISSPTGTVIGYTCGGQEFIHGLLRLCLSVHNLEIIKHSHPDDIKYHITADFDCKFIEEMVQLFSAQFWQDMDEVEIQEGDLKGDGVKVIAGPFSRETSHVIVVNKGLIVLVVMQEGRTTENIEVSKFFMQSFSKDHGLIVLVVLQDCGAAENIEVSKLFVQSYSKDHVLSCSVDDCTDLAHPLAKGEALPGDLWINPNGFCVHFNDGAGGDEIDEDSMTLVKPCHVHIKPSPHTLTLTKDKGYNVTVGDIVEVARGNYYHCEGVVKAVDLTNALLDIVCPVEGNQTKVPITFCCKVKERSENELSKFVGHDVWVIGGEKKGCQATLHSLGRTYSLVALFGHQLIQLKNDQIATP
ncbi:hypothetical protein SCLCIDRAFT_23581 [Scleroderma citrinum Foug A]|uniref:Uncharacterized protein n=1 Tax=Scleroderma citrinum Foug A TaxID=1036808 RepID=A0A0C3DUD5_9AGAM|nr:hypothetical protein SCLCIDRAFT_23581 [Scleroderma citrinum Foug A]